MQTHAFSGPSIGALMVVAGILVGVGRKVCSGAFWRPDRSVGFPLRFLLGLCILYGTTWLLQLM